jgi:flagellar protein FlaF
MGTASLIATAIGVLLLIVTAYVLAGGTITVAETVATAQRDSVNLHEIRMRTAIEIRSAILDTNSSTLVISVENTGNERLDDFDHTDVFLLIDGIPKHGSYHSGDCPWTILSIQPDVIHPGQLDPGEVMTISVLYNGSSPTWVQVTTSSGVSASHYVG